MKGEVKMANFTYLVDRGGRIHVWDTSTPNKRDPWQRAICGDPGDFNQFLQYDVEVTCTSCRKKLGMLTQVPLFKDKSKECPAGCLCSGMKDRRR